ncbi:MAG: ketose-bisphosphate aldolase [Alphaproteobacteria bacterium]|nr:ketose-bisphosphate aldolase [Alphaproteobacteria bacterium]
MKFSDFGFVNTNNMLKNALVGGYAVPAFNFYNMETLTAIVSAARKTHSPVILAASESAIQYMGDDMLLGLMTGICASPSEQIALHLDHGHTLDACIHAIDLGFSSVMIDASNKSFEENIKLSHEVAKYAHRHNVSVEAELGILNGIEDKNTKSTKSSYTDPDAAAEFVKRTGIDSLAIAIGTSHGPYKCKTTDDKLRFDILKQIEKKIPDVPLVLHGASNVHQKFLDIINTYGGKLKDACGIDQAQLRRVAKTNICKINVDSDLRLAFTAAVRKTLKTDAGVFNPRDYLVPAIKYMTETCVYEITHKMYSKDKI